MTMAPPARTRPAPLTATVVRTAQLSPTMTRVVFGGPGLASFHLYVGDESALPAIAAALEQLPADATGRVLVEVPGPESAVPLVVPAGVQVTWVPADGRGVGAALVEATRAVDFPADAVDAF